jgi:hypothetical protein
MMPGTLTRSLFSGLSELVDVLGLGGFTGFRTLGDTVATRGGEVPQRVRRLLAAVVRYTFLVILNRLLRYGFFAFPFGCGFRGLIGGAWFSCLCCFRLAYRGLDGGFTYETILEEPHKRIMHLCSIRDLGEMA